MSDSTECDICHREGDHKMGCPNRPGYGDCIILNMKGPSSGGRTGEKS